MKTLKDQASVTYKVWVEIQGTDIRSGNVNMDGWIAGEYRLEGNAVDKRRELLAKGYDGDLFEDVTHFEVMVRECVDTYYLESNGTWAMIRNEKTILR